MSNLETAMSYELSAFAALSWEGQLDQLSAIAASQGGDAFEMVSRQARIGELIATMWKAHNPATDEDKKSAYADIRNIVHRRFAVGFYSKMMGGVADADAVAALTAPTKTAEAKSADAIATTNFNRCWKLSSVANPMARAPRTLKKADKDEGADKGADKSADDQGEQSQEETASAPLDQIIAAMVRLSIPDLMQAVAAVAAAKAHNPGKSWSQFDLDCVNELGQVAAFWSQGEKAENAKDVTPPPAEIAAPKKASGKRQAKAA